ncbi:unnamed protein product [Clavelina lepadiformis]|uniref:Uncharacterized protein n=1 Tax=Clavelina lepadiformis TaxID=159417 RepID=A0ABP0G0S4_CLALP
MYNAKTLINILRPVRTFSNVNCTFWHHIVHKTLINNLRRVRTFCNVKCTFGTILFTSSQDPLELFAIL